MTKQELKSAIYSALGEEKADKRISWALDWTGSEISALRYIYNEDVLTVPDAEKACRLRDYYYV